ncbi:uncharacterized protein V1513DRAFT_449756 [Lipomyces chichibuensis]|uniref:uncharacterized protein n=1 Tax=Lipomyces chichibuensis TaxID=1546026 RepID=UPI00334413C9
MMLFKGKLVALLYGAILSDCVRCVRSRPTLQPNAVVEYAAVHPEYSVIRISNYDYVAEMNLVSDVILCTVGLLEFLIRANILKPCWMGCGNEVRHPINTIDLTPRNSLSETPSYSAVLSNMSFSVRFPHEVLDVLKDPMVQQLIASNPIPALSGAMDDSSREPYVKIENTNVTLHLHDYLGLDASSSAISDDKDESDSIVEVVDITPLLELLESILHDTKGVCTYLRVLNGDQVTTRAVRIPDAVYEKAKEMHGKLHVIQQQGTRIILLDDAMFNAGTFVCTARELIESLKICFREDT